MDAFVVASLNVSADEFFRTHAGVVGDQTVERVLQALQKLRL